MKMHDAVTVATYALAGSGAAAVASAGALHLVRRRSLRTQLLIVGLGSALTISAGVLVGAGFMFISSHDLGVLGVVLAVSLVLSVASAIYLGRNYSRSGRNVVAIAQQLGQPGHVGQADASGPLEMRDLANELHLVSGRLHESRQREAALDSSRRELVAWVSHDLRSPIASIRAMAEALEDHVVDDDVSIGRYHRSIRLESERLGALVDDLFELSRIASGKISSDQPFVPAGELVGEIIEGVGSAADSRGVSIVSYGDDLAGALVPAADLRRVLHNLLDNAIRHTSPGGCVRVEGSIVDRHFALTVSDECGGIPEDELPRVFDVAFRGDTARTRDRAGGGLGLAIARGLVEAHAGSISVVNRAHGCRFTLRLPLDRRPVEANRPDHP